MTTLRPATLEDARSLAPRLRQQDSEELAAMGHPDNLTALLTSIAISDEAYAFEVDGEVLALAGVASIDHIGVPWLLGTDDLLKHRKSLLAIPKQHIQEWASRYALLSNFVHIKNHVSITWLAHLGFEIHPAVWVEGGLFHPFTLKGNTNV